MSSALLLERIRATYHLTLTLALTLTLTLTLALALALAYTTLLLESV